MSCNCNGSSLEATEPSYGPSYLKTLLAIGIVLTPVFAVFALDSHLGKQSQGRNGFRGLSGGRHGGRYNATKAEVYAGWKNAILPMLQERYEQDGIPDKPARRESWNDYLDNMIRNGDVPRSAENWTHPRGLETVK